MATVNAGTNKLCPYPKVGALLIQKRAHFP